MNIFILLLTTVVIPMIVMSAVSTYGEVFVEHDERALAAVRGKSYTAIACALASLPIWFFTATQI